jgi:hypothetical protein
VSIIGGGGIGVRRGPFVGRSSPPPSTLGAVARSRGVGGVLVLWWCHPQRDPVTTLGADARSGGVGRRRGVLVQASSLPVRT